MLAQARIMKFEGSTGCRAEQCQFVHPVVKCDSLPMCVRVSLITLECFTRTCGVRLWESWRNVGAPGDILPFPYQCISLPLLPPLFSCLSGRMCTHRHTHLLPGQHKQNQTLPWKQPEMFVHSVDVFSWRVNINWTCLSPLKKVGLYLYHKQ